jgi:hypothetical protein
MRGDVRLMSDTGLWFSVFVLAASFALLCLVALIARAYTRDKTVPASWWVASWAMFSGAAISWWMVLWL